MSSINFLRFQILSTFTHKDLSDGKQQKLNNAVISSTNVTQIILKTYTVMRQSATWIWFV